MRRREFIVGLGAAALPVVARGQQALPVIGYLSTAAPNFSAERLRAFRRGLREVGYIEGENLSIEYGWANGQYDRLPKLAMDMVHLDVKVIVSAGGIPSALAAKAATSKIPIVFVVGGDPVAFGLVGSLTRPGGNLTGSSVMIMELEPKKIELLHELIPSAQIVAMLVNPTNPAAAADIRIAQGAARSLGLELQVLNATSEREIDHAFAELRAGGLLIAADLLFNNRIEQIASLAARHAVPAVWRPEFAEAGGLMGYGGDIEEPNRLVGEYAGRILKGEKPADLPIQQVSKVELVINMKTAKMLGLTVPLKLLGRADKVIE